MSFRSSRKSGQPDSISRRQILMGASGFALGLPVLESLLPRSVRAQGSPPERRFVAFATDHGGVDETAMFPAESLLTTTSELYSDHSVRRGDLGRSEADGRAQVSAILSGPAERFSVDIASRMNVLRGLDIPFYIAHHTGGHLGNFARNDGNGSDGQNIQADMMPTIDQVMAWSSAFYGDAAGIVERVLVLGQNSRLSWCWKNPATRTGEIEEITSQRDPRSTFQKVFLPGEDPSVPEPRPLIVDRVIESYRSLRDSDRRLSPGDRQRLQDHMDRLFELERRLNTSSAPRASCGDAKEPDSNYGDSPAAYYAAWNDVIVAAFLCGTSRLSVVKINESSFVDYAGDWHQEVAHQYTNAEPQRLLQEANQKAFEFAVLDLVHKLNIEEAEGKNLLDSTLVQWSQESGDQTHNARSIPLVTFGSGGGGIKTGNYCDYRRISSEGRLQNGYGGNSGLLYAQWLAMVLQTMGLGANEFGTIEHNAAKGYGHPFVSEEYASSHAEGVVEGASDELPFLGI